MSAMPGWRGEVFSWIPHLAASGEGRDSVDVAGIATTVEAKWGQRLPTLGASPEECLLEQLVHWSHSG